MNGRWGVAGSAVLLTGLVACGSQGAGSSPPNTGGVSTTNVTTTSLGSPSVSTTSVTTTGVSTTGVSTTVQGAHAMVRTTGGLVEVTGADGVLEVVQLVPSAGWTSHVDRPGQGELTVTFRRGAATDVVGFEMSELGIRTTTSATATG